MNSANQSSRRIFQYKSRTQEELLEQWTRRVYGDTPSAQWATKLYCIRFEWFISVIPSKSIPMAYLRQLFNSFVAELPGTLGYVVGFENDPIPHFHVCLVSRPKLEKDRIETTLRKLFGTNPDSIDVQEYDLNRNGVGYTLKCLDDGSGDYDFSNLEPFKPNSHTRRQARRLQEMTPFRRAFMKRFRAATGVEEKTGQMTL